MTKSKGILRPRHPWSAEQVQTLITRYPDEPSVQLARALGITVHQVYRKARSPGLAKSDAFNNSPASGRLTGLDDRGIAGRFPKGHVPPNKGVKGWQAGGRSAETRFKKGNKCTGSRAELPLGHERVNADGYLERKVRMDLYGALRWKAVHRLNWEEAHGPIPAGHCLWFRDGNRLNVSLANLELIDMKERMRRTTVHNLPAPVRDLVLLRGALVRKINKRTKDADHERDA